jgi:hypothetical protein
MTSDLRLDRQAPGRQQHPLARIDRQADGPIYGWRWQWGLPNDIPTQPDAQVIAVQGQFPFDGISQILHEMKTVRHLFGGWGTLACGLGVPPVAVPTNRVDVRMGQQPVLDDIGGVRIQYVSHRSAFQVHYNRAEDQTFALRPFIHADHARSRNRWSYTPLEPPQDRVVTDRQTNSAHEPFTRPTSERVTNQPGHRVRPASAAATHLSDTRQHTGEESDRAPRVTTSPAADTHSKRHRGTEGRQIFERSHVSTMTRERYLTAAWARRLVRPVCHHRPAGIVPLQRRQLE